MRREDVTFGCSLFICWRTDMCVVNKQNLVCVSPQSVSLSVLRWSQRSLRRGRPKKSSTGTTASSMGRGRRRSYTTSRKCVVFVCEWPSFCGGFTRRHSVVKQQRQHSWADSGSEAAGDRNLVRFSSCGGTYYRTGKLLSCWWCCDNRTLPVRVWSVFESLTKPFVVELHLHCG